MRAIVGIDIGLTCTGVAVGFYDNADIQGPKVIQKWPGLESAVANKVPTKVAFKAGKAGIHSWGFLCPPIEKLGPGMAVKDFFKFHLDPSFLRDNFESNLETIPGALEDVKFWYGGFLGALYLHIVKYLQDLWKENFDATKVEYIFSLPTSWKDKDRLVQSFRRIVEVAGFGEDVTMELTEGEASAVFTAKELNQKFKEGDDFIVVDAGGGTTDMCVLRVTQVIGQALQLENLDDPQALPVGSLNIDEMFEQKAQKALNDIGRTELSQHMAHQITRDGFQSIKAFFGTPRILPISKIEVPGLSERIELSHDELKAMFDVQISKILEFIDKEIKFLGWNRPEVNLSYLVLAGGLGSSEYLQAEIMEHYKQMKILFAEKPEDLPLAVCKGLVINRLQHLTNNTSVIPIRSSSASYGILCNELYTKMHSGQHTWKNLLDGNKYVANQVDWLTKKSQKLKEGEIITRKYWRIVSVDEQTKTWGFAVVSSRLTPHELPDVLEDDEGAKIICYAVSDSEQSSDIASIIHRRRLLGKGLGFRRVDYKLSAIIERGNLRFETSIIGQAESETRTLKVLWENDQLTESGREKNWRVEDGLIRSG